MLQNLTNLTGKVAIITGASKGIGEAIAYFFAAAGAKVVINSRKQAELDEVAATIQAKTDSLCIGIAANTGDAEGCKLLVQKTVEQFGGVDILVNNAATNPIFGSVASAEGWAFDKIMAINVKAPFELGNLVYPIMCERGGGSIINISSVAATTPDAGLGLYSVSKAALNMLTKVMAKEWGSDNIRVNTISPGLIKTKFSAAIWQNDKVLNHFQQQLPISRMGTPEEIASLTLFLASDAGSYCTGANFTADGGLTI